MRRFTGFLALSALVLAADQGSKLLVQRALAPGDYVPVAGSVFGVRLTANTGAAFSLFAGGGPVLVAVTVVAIGVILYYSWRARHLRRLMLAALALQLGGAVGNLIDRLRFGHVVDFIYTSFWPTFNVADIGITVGALLLCYCLLAQPAETVGSKP